ncbi:MAG: hypothetical protein V1800_00285 [Candidatus Latescibacterota bacterium]
MSDLPSSFKRRHEGTRWRVLYGSYEPVEQFALHELQRMLQRYLPYVIRVESSQADLGDHEDHLLLIGTASNNPGIRSLVEQGKVSVPDRPEGYGIGCLQSPWNPNRRIIAIAGHDAAGVQHGVMHFGAEILGVRHGEDDPKKKRDVFDRMPDFGVKEAPRIQNRGIWTWGYAIHDYRRFLDNMARLRMNMLTLWNDCPPVNISEILHYAHSRGIRIILGFHWGWGTTGIDLTDDAHIQLLKKAVLENYQQHYAHLPHDGIYFQTLTETSEKTVKNQSIAGLACNLVNNIGRALLQKYPDLAIQFGLHATSIRDHYTCLEALDPRITLTWEDAGVIPYSYDPVAQHDPNKPHVFQGPKSVDETIAYSKKLAAIRGGREFAMVPKGFTCIRWETEFENHASFILGERSMRAARDRLCERQPRWDTVNGLWMRNYPDAQRFFREILGTGTRKVTATALVEDGMFEIRIQPAIALLAHILWNPDEDEKMLPQLALSSYYRESAA